MLKQDIRFYHLQNQPAELALPALLNKALQGGKRIAVRVPDARMAAQLDDHLWTYDAGSFLPHGLASDAHAADHPIVITDSAEALEDRDMLLLAFGASGEASEGYDLICRVFDGRDEMALNAARAEWKALKDAEAAELTYWQQGDRGWEKKA